MKKSSQVHYSMVMHTIIANGNGHDRIKTHEIIPVIMNGTMKAIVFVKVDDKCYIVIGDTSPYKVNCYRNNKELSGLALIDGCGIWHEVEKDEGNAIYKKIIGTKTLTNNRITYRFTL